MVIQKAVQSVKAAGDWAGHMAVVQKGGLLIARNAAADATVTALSVNSSTRMQSHIEFVAPLW